MYLLLPPIRSLGDLEAPPPRILLDTVVGRWVEISFPTTAPPRQEKRPLNVGHCWPPELATSTRSCPALNCLRRHCRVQVVLTHEIRLEGSPRSIDPPGALTTLLVHATKHQMPLGSRVRKCSYLALSYRTFSLPFTPRAARLSLSQTPHPP